MSRRFSGICPTVCCSTKTHRDKTGRDAGFTLDFPINPNEHTEQYERTAGKYGCYIQSGSFLEYDPDYPDSVFNTSVLIGPDGILAKYRKMNPWIPWEVHAGPHDFADYDREYFPVVDTEIGKLGTAICYDWAFPETIRQIADNGAEIITRVSAYMDPWGAVPPTEWWSLFNRVRAIENMVYVVAANQGTTPAGLPPFSWPGSSMILVFPAPAGTPGYPLSVVCLVRCIYFIPPLKTGRCKL